MRYCQRCILPETRPGLVLGADGVCSACRAHEERTSEQVDWEERRRAFAAIAEDARGRGRDWDCVIPVSGGKDSHWQTLTCLEFGLKPLAVTWRTPGRNALGERNLRNLVELGVDHVDASVNPEVERRFLVKAFERLGTTAIPMHLAIFNIPTRLAVQLGIPLVVWGENSALEYEGSEAGFELTSEWVRRHGAVHGTTAADWEDEELSARDLAIYRGPSDAEMRHAGVRAVFLGMYLPWDPQMTYEAAREHGFEPAPAPLTGSYAFADVDDDFISLHHWLKWHKFGFTRVWDNLSLEIRNGRLSRPSAIELARAAGNPTPHEDIRAFCDYTGMPDERFRDVAESFRSEEVWTRVDGTWTIEDFLIPDWDWAAEAR
jgi:N-acetyl sugar amidotransferase